MSIALNRLAAVTSCNYQRFLATLDTKVSVRTSVLSSKRSALRSFSSMTIQFG